MLAQEAQDSAHRKYTTGQALFSRFDQDTPQHSHSALSRPPGVEPRDQYKTANFARNESPLLVTSRVPGKLSPRTFMRTYKQSNLDPTQTDNGELVIC